MEKLISEEKMIPEIDYFQVSVVMQRKPGSSQWQEFQWQAIGIVVMDRTVDAVDSDRVIFDAAGVRHYLLTGYRLHLYRDECESYYHNLMTATPGCFVVAHPGDDQMPEPFLVTLSFDEAHSYLEGDEEIYTVDIPPEIYKWVEQFILENYQPEKRKKRKRDDWKRPTNPSVRL